ncbi:hypothetical protein [Escherichia coli]|uniref:hypothetical protein n=1 Tax=Escherichia coli TaxID=562 RepID=UPI00158DA5A4|nr:hypothetical protein [Escherichia coli]
MKNSQPLWRLAGGGKKVKLLWKKASDSAFRFLLVTVEDHRRQQGLAANHGLRERGKI